MSHCQIMQDSRKSTPLSQRGRLVSESQSGGYSKQVGRLPGTLQCLPGHKARHTQLYMHSYRPGKAKMSNRHFIKVRSHIIESKTLRNFTNTLWDAQREPSSLEQFLSLSVQAPEGLPSFCSTRQGKKRPEIKKDASIPYKIVKMK